MSSTGKEDDDSGLECCREHEPVSMMRPRGGDAH